jgi:C-terminal processing protease CtpA/Prc
MNTHKDAINRVRKLMFAPGTDRAKQPVTAAETRSGRLTTQTVKTAMPDAFKPLIVGTSLGDFGYIRIFTFRVDSEDQVDEFVKEFARLVESLPQQGLIIDVRGNGGGHIGAAERLLQLLTHRTINPTSFEIINNPLNLEICRRLGWFNWADSIAQSVLTGATHSRGFPITSEEACNDTGQIYFGPALLITDALCYSATDMFAASFQDHEIGQILGVSGNTGAGGANVLSHDDLTQWMSGHGASSPFKTLPKGIGMRVAFRRCIRSGKNAGRPLEELGVVPDRRYYMTRDDLLHDNRDLICYAATKLRIKN